MKETRMKRTSFITLALVLAVAASVVFSGGCGRGEEGTTDVAQSVPVETMRVAPSLVAPSLSYSGSVTAGRKALLGAEIQGRVERIHVEVGDRVARGALLAEMASEQLIQAEAQYIVVEKDRERMRTLLEKGAVTQQAFDQVAARYEAAKAAYDMIHRSARITAPFAGVISGRYLDEGEVFTLMPTGTGSPAVFELIQMDPVKIVINVAERERPSVSPGLVASVTVDGFPGNVFRGKVERVDPAFDPMTRTSSSEVVVPNPDELLRPGMFADVELTLGERSVLLVSRDAIVRQEGTGVFYVYVVENQTAHRRELELGQSFGQDVEVLRGLTEGDEVVTAGRYRLQDGTAVRVRGAVGESPAGTADPGPGSGSAGEESDR
jgi:membrane fusion protein (multidrug efflux system)